MPTDKTTNDPTFCPHCNKKMSKWRAADLNAWGPVVQYVCFNDECPYYINGWKWMEERFGTTCSYRHRYNPETKESGPLPVYSDTVGKSQIVSDGDEETASSNQEKSE